MYEIRPTSTPELWQVVNIESGRVVVNGISREGCQRLKAELERNALKRMLQLAVNGHVREESRQER
jgi:hypothetical protein